MPPAQGAKTAEKILVPSRTSTVPSILLNKLFTGSRPTICSSEKPSKWASSKCSSMSSTPSLSSSISATSGTPSISVSIQELDRESCAKLTDCPVPAIVGTPLACMPPIKVSLAI